MDVIAREPSVIDLPGTRRITGLILARDVSFEDFMTGYDNLHVEWVDGVVVEMPSITERHDALVAFLRMWISALLERLGAGRVLGDPMIMKLEAARSSRAPDLQVLLPDQLYRLKTNVVIGPANLVIEVVSPGSRRTDTVDKFQEYEQGGVPEYWLIDYERRRTVFFRLNSNGIYEESAPDQQGIYQSAAVPGLWLPVDLLWRDALPGPVEIVRLTGDPQ